MINVTQSIDAISNIAGVSDIYETFNGLHSTSFTFIYENNKCFLSIDKSILTICLMGDKCNFKRSWALTKQESSESFMKDVEFFLKDSIRKNSI
jgi:hypothetical protein